MQKAADAYHQVSVQTRRDELILNHLPLVRHTISRMLAQLPPGMDVENLESAGTLGLVEAANKFDPERGIKFETFAYRRIRGAVLDELRRNCPIPQHLLERMAKVRTAYKSLPAPATVEALAEATTLSVDEVSDCLAAMRLTRQLSWENLSEPAQARAQSRETPAETHAELAEQKRALAEAITQLPERERLVVTLYYLEDLRLKEIGQVLKLSESRVSRVLSSALFTLGENLRTDEA